MKRLLLSLVFSSSIFYCTQAQKINWYAWGETPFKKAKQLNRPIFLDVGTEWCTACNLMEEKTYTDTAVINFINKNFISIKADAEAQPDVGARFLEWGWPALIFLDSNGNQLKALQGNRQPDVFLPILKEFIANYNAGKTEIQDNDFFSSETPDKSSLQELDKKAYNQLDYYYDSLNAGWGYVLKIPLYQPVEYSFWLSKTNPNKKSEINKALLSLTKYAEVSDRQCGGVYFGCGGSNWKGAQPEKRSEYQGGVMNNYAQAYMATGNAKWLKEALLLKKYLLTSMLSKKDSLFYNSQEEYLTLDKSALKITPEKYFLLPVEQRKKYGEPPIDKTLYTDINFRIIKAFLKLYEATGDSSNLTIAVSVAKKIMAKAHLQEGWFKTVIENKNSVARMRELPSDSAQKNIMYLKPQSHSGLAMLQLYQFTNDTFWLQQCRILKDVVIAKLYDKENGGFFSTNLMPVTFGGKRAATKVLNENALFARFLIELGDLTDDESLYKIADATLKAVGVDKILKNEERLIADYNLAVAKAIKHHVVFTVVTTDPNSAETKKLVKQVQGYYHPQKLIKVEAPGHYPDLGTPSLFVCSKNVCSSPINYSDKTKSKIDDFIIRLK